MNIVIHHNADCGTSRDVLGNLSRVRFARDCV